MKQRFILLLAGLLALLASCAPPRPAEDGALHVLASTYPIYLFATAVAEGVDGVEVELLVNQPTACRCAPAQRRGAGGLFGGRPVRVRRRSH